MVTDDEVHMVRNAAHVAIPRHAHGDGVTSGLSPWPNALRTGMNGGYQALGLAIAAGAARVVLVGYDMRFDNKGKSHWHGGHAKDPSHSDGVYRTMYRRYFEELKLPAGVQVLNCSPVSLIEAFPKVSIEAALQPN